MNSIKPYTRNLLSVTLAAIFAVGCASAPQAPAGSAEVRSQLNRLQADPQLAVLAPLAIKDAEQAVRLAEQPDNDSGLTAHRLIVAERKVVIALSLAQTRQLELQRAELSQQRDDVRLNARTREAASARADANAAREDAIGARSEAEQAREQSLLAAGREDQALTAAARARDDARAAREQAEQSAATAGELRAQVAELNARPTDRGLVVTLGDVLFNTGQANLKVSSSNHLEKLAGFLTEHPERTALIEGHTDNVGSAASNVLLSQRRAEAVKTFLTAQGVALSRLTTVGKGLDMPLASNSTAEGRAQNRRVEVIIANPDQ
ncbi:Outer membrane protein OmpA [Arsukibacterium tuosuense]|uniref:Outer membrane protein OmpA n=1 Tax=Arsukibacterium tuosuense TaxID=1323745 RepID=A0A285INB1_9GAMM|nr:OmpA family protein [Arsukibacterium tuosuense]SNY49373.1 Outer membrane protein OmpA [Arsukibacterium tuosuense]